MWIRNPTPVTISSMIELSGSTRNEKGMFKVPAFIQSNKGITKLDSEGSSLVDVYTSPKIAQLIRNEAKTVMFPTNPAALFDSTLRPNPMTKKPISGNKGTNQTKFIISTFVLSFNNYPSDYIRAC